jgi:hypothetical protein
MPDHWHALIWTGHPLTISQAIHDVKRVSARQLYRQRGTQGPVWQHQFWDRFVRHAREFSDRLDYIHLNPVRKGPGEQAGAVAMVELQQFLPRPSDRGGLVRFGLITSAFLSNTGRDLTGKPRSEKH